MAGLRAKAWTIVVTIGNVFALFCVASSLANADQPLRLSVSSNALQTHILLEGAENHTITPTVNGKQLSLQFSPPLTRHTQISTKTDQSVIEDYAVSADYSTLFLQLNQEGFTFRKFLTEHGVGVDLLPPLKQIKAFIPQPVLRYSEVKSEPPFIRQVLELAADDVMPPAQMEPASTEEATNTISPLENTSEMLQSTALTDMSMADVVDEIRFPWDRPVGAVVFKREEYLWIVFDRYKKFDTQSILTKHAALFTSAVQLKNPYYTILSFKLRTPQLPFVAFTNNQGWTIASAEENYRPVQPLTLLQDDSNLHGTSIILTGEDEVRPLRFRDPFVGDELLVIPYQTQGFSYAGAWRFTDYVVLPTIQGGAVQLISDEVQFKAVKLGVKLAGPTNRLAGSAQAVLRELRERERLAKLKAKKARKVEDTIFKFTGWRQEERGSFWKAHTALKEDITLASWEEKSEARLALAQFYFAHNLEVEANTVIQTMKAYDPEFGESFAVKTLEGIVKFYTYRYREAYDIFQSVNLDDAKSEMEREEVRFWIGASAVKVSNQVSLDQSISTIVNEEEEEEESEIIDADNKVQGTRLILETSSRLVQMIRQLDPEFVNAKELQQLESMARFVSNHYQDSVTRFQETDAAQVGNLFEAEEDKLWWGMGSAWNMKTGEMKFLKYREDFLRFYPVEVYNDVALLAAQNRLLINDFSAVEEILALVKTEEDKRQHVDNSVNFLQGLYKTKFEEIEEAIAIWDELGKQVDDRFNRARAKFSKTVVQLQNDLIDTETAIDQLNDVRMLWRGGALELNTLRMLGELYMEQKNYMEAFRAWRNAITYYPQTNDALLLTKRMSQNFVRVFSEEDNDLTDLEALTLFYEFRELTPIGRVGDEMIGRLIDRLVKVSLLDRAVALLTHQVRFRLTGEDRDNAAIKLIRIHLRNQEPQSAIDVLKATEHDNIAPDLVMERRYLESAALIELGRNNQVLTLMNNDDSSRASFIRADVYWREKVWNKVIEELEAPFREMRRREQKLTHDEAEHLLKLAVAYSLVDRNRRLQILYEDFINYVPDNNQRRVFEFVATNNEPISIDDLENNVQADDMETFLREYIDEHKYESYETEENEVKTENEGI